MTKCVQKGNFDLLTHKPITHSVCKINELDNEIISSAFLQFSCVPNHEGELKPGAIMNSNEFICKCSLYSRFAWFSELPVLSVSLLLLRKTCSIQQAAGKSRFSSGSVLLFANLSFRNKRSRVLRVH